MASKEVLLPLIAVVERGATKAFVVPRMAVEANSRVLNFMVVVVEIAEWILDYYFTSSFRDTTAFGCSRTEFAAMTTL